MRLPSSARGWVSGLASVSGATHAARALESGAVDCMPIKGALIAATVRRGGLERHTADVDLLIHSSERQRAGRCLSAAGYVCESNAEHASTWRHPTLSLPLDLHTKPFPFGLYRMKTADLFERAQRGDGQRGGRVWLPKGEDVYALAIGHLAKDRRHETARLLELADIARYFQLRADCTAAHLVSQGMGRAARWVLAISKERAKDRFASEVLESLPSDRVGTLAVALAGYWIAAVPLPRRANMPACHLLNRSLPEGARSLVSQASSFLTHRSTPALRRASRTPKRASASTQSAPSSKGARR